MLSPLPNQPTEAGQSQPRAFVVWLTVLSVALGFFQVFGKRYEVGGDVISYLDLGDAIFRGDWANAEPGLFWPPLYGCILGFFLAVLKPSPYWEYPLVQAVNFVIFLLALGAFRFFLKEFRQFRIHAFRKDGDANFVGSGEPAVTLIAYALFIWCSIDLIGVATTNPDMTLAALLFLASAIMLRIARGERSLLLFASLGLLLGLGYLAKAAMFPLSLVYLGVLYCLVGKRQIKGVIAAAACFCFLSAPLAAVLSANADRFTFSDQGRLNYAWHVDGVRYPTHWHGEHPSKGNPAHPTRKLLNQPEVYEFGGPINATYPPWYAPSYWYCGLEPYFNLKAQIKALITNGKVLSDVILFGMNGALAAGMFLTLWMSSSPWRMLKDAWRYWFLLVPSATALLMYSMIHLEPRYIAAFVVLFSLPCLAGLKSEDRDLSVGIGSLMLGMCLVIAIPEAVGPSVDQVRGITKDANIFYQVAQKLRNLGLMEGDRIASIDGSMADIASVARLAKVSVVAEIPGWPGSEEGFWNATPETRRKIIELFQKTGAVLVIANERPRGPDAINWVNLGVSGSIKALSAAFKTEYYAYLLSPLKERLATKK